MDKETTGDRISALRYAAKMANLLAKRVAGEDREIAYTVKNELINVLILEGVADANALPINGIVGVDIGDDPPTRLHIPMSKLAPAVRARIVHSFSHERGH